MEGFEDYEKMRRFVFKKKTQSFSIKVYLSIILILLLGAWISLPFSMEYSFDEKTRILLIITTSSVINIVLLIVGYREKKKLARVDWILLYVTLVTYVILLILSPNMKILNTAIFMPMFILFVISTFKIRHSYILLGAHSMVLVYTMSQYPRYSTTITYGTFVNIGIVTIILIIGTRQFILLMNNYQKQSFEDQREIHEKNIELTALNEEYYATQEQLIHQFDEIEHLAYYDNLTGVYNRVGLAKEIMGFQSLVGAGYYLVLVDILRFRDVNSVYNYEIGDQVLNALSFKLSNLISDKVRYMGRIGGDVFALVFDGNVRKDQLIKAVRALNPNIYYKDYEIKISCYFGITYSEQGADDYISVMNRAEIALEKAKNNLDRYCFYDDKFGEEVEQRVKINSALESAIESEHIFLNYQPIYVAKTAKVYGYESLARWLDDELGYVPPDKFIAVAENSMIIHPLGKLIAKQAGRFSLEASKMGLEGRVSINISGIELGNKDFAISFIETMSVTEAMASHIAIEITETGLIQHKEYAARNLKLLKEAGYSIYLDDFGTGYSSLSYIDQLPIDVLKIDKSFVDQVLTNDKKRKLLAAMIGLASNLEIKTIAEGVETHEQYDLLRAMGIDYIQGYYFSKPLKMDEALKLLQNSEKASELC